MWRTSIYNIHRDSDNTRKAHDKATWSYSILSKKQAAFSLSLSFRTLRFHCCSWVANCTSRCGLSWFQPSQGHSDRVVQSNTISAPGIHKLPARRNGAFYADFGVQDYILLPKYLCNSVSIQTWENSSEIHVRVAPTTPSSHIVLSCLIPCQWIGVPLWSESWLMTVIFNKCPQSAWMSRPECVPLMSMQEIFYQSEASHLFVKEDKGILWSVSFETSNARLWTDLSSRASVWPVMLVGLLWYWSPYSSTVYHLIYTQIAMIFLWETLLESF